MAQDGNHHLDNNFKKMLLNGDLNFAEFLLGIYILWRLMGLQSAVDFIMLSNNLLFQLMIAMFYYPYVHN